MQNVYATLVVRLSHSGFFKKKALWRNAITYITKREGTYGIRLKEIEEGRAELTLMQRWWYFFEGSVGCIGILKQWLVRALYRALREESTELTRAHLEKSVLPDAKWERMRARVNRQKEKKPACLLPL